jgi:peptidyl-dipeptidase A
MDMNDVLKKSNLTYEEKKQQLPFSIDIDRQGDVRISAGIDYNAQSMYALLYETGFSASYKYINKDLPYILKQPSHFIISDAGAQLFGQMTSNPAWLETEINLSKTETDAISNGSKKHTALSKFIFSRWALVVYHFEKDLYADPEQDMNKLWWNLVERYQMLKKPEGRNEPDWASKPHIVSQSCQYHNYMLGEMLASQIKNYILKTHGKKSVDFDASCLKNKELGKYFIEKLYAPGLSVPWTILIKNATGQELSTEYFTKEYIDK